MASLSKYTNPHGESNMRVYFDHNEVKLVNVCMGDRWCFTPVIIEDEVDHVHRSYLYLKAEKDSTARYRAKLQRSGRERSIILRPDHFGLYDLDKMLGFKPSIKCISEVSFDGVGSHSLSGIRSSLPIASSSGITIELPELAGPPGISAWRRDPLEAVVKLPKQRELNLDRSAVVVNVVFPDDTIMSGNLTMAQAADMAGRYGLRIVEV